MKEITVPDLGSAGDVTVIEILVQTGDKVEVDTPVVTLESDKATMEVPTTFAGVVKEIKVKTGAKVASGSVLLTLEEAVSKDSKNEATKAETKADKKIDKKEENNLSSVVPQQTKVAAVQAQESSASVEQENIHAGPGVRRLARELDIDLSAIAGSGPKNRILKEDIRNFIKQGFGNAQTASRPVLPVIDFSQYGQVEVKSLSRLKKISGNNLQRNWAMIPHVTQFGQADITELDIFRQSQKAALEKEQIKLTPLVFVMKAIVATLKVFPQFNASLDPSGEQLILKQYFHIGVAVDTPEGLVVPVIRNVDKRGIKELAQDLALVSQKARKKQLMPADMQGGCFSISSLGGIGGTAFTPIINYPEVAILGMSKTAYQPVYQAGHFVPRLMLPLSLSYDHRVIDGAEGARFMVHLTQILSDIRNLLL